MDLQKDKYIIAEIIPTRSDPKEGFIAQISALKLDGIKLEDRFDYRVEDKFIESEDLKQMISYDKKSFTYVNNIYFIIEKFKQWAKDYPLLILEDKYTKKYLKEMKNSKELVYQYRNTLCSQESAETSQQLPSSIFTDFLKIINPSHIMII